MTALDLNRAGPVGATAALAEPEASGVLPRIVRPIRLLYLLPAEAFGGSERQGVEHIAGLMKMGFAVTAVVGPGKPIRDELHRRGVFQYVFMDDFPATGPSRAAWAGTVGDWLEWIKVAPSCFRSIQRIARSDTFDIVFGNRAISWPLAAMIAAKLGVPYVIRSGGRPANPLTRPMLLALRAMLPPPALFLANCEAVRAPLAGWFDCPSAILRNGVDPERYHPRDAAACRRVLGLPSGPIVGMAARPAPEKGLDFFAAVAGATLQRAPDATFAIAGEHVTRASYEHRIARLGLARSIKFLGHVSDMPSFYGSCDIVVLTSPRASIEGSPNALLEAMAMARPIVATRVGGVPELVRHRVDGLLSDPGDTQEFAAHTLLLLEHPQLRVKMGASGRKRAVESYGSGAMIRHLAAMLRLVAMPETPQPAQSLATSGGLGP